MEKIQRCIPKVLVCVCVAVCVMSSVISPANNVLLTRPHSLTTDLQICTYKYGERKESLGIIGDSTDLWSCDMCNDLILLVNAS